MSNLATATYVETPTGPPPLLETWDEKVKLLNYPLGEYLVRCEIYEVSEDSNEDQEEEYKATSFAEKMLYVVSYALDIAKAPLTVNISLGQWNGFIDNGEDSAEYPNGGMISFNAQHCPDDGHDFEDEGRYYSTNFSLTGNWDVDCDGTLSVRFVRSFSARYDTKYYSGHITLDGSLVGTMGATEDSSEHFNNFLMRQVPAEVMCFRPSPAEFASHRIRALWKFATQATLFQVRKEMWSWSYFADRRDKRQAYIKYLTRLARHPLSSEEKAIWLGVRQGLTAQDANFVHSVCRYRLLFLPCQG